MRVCRRPQPRKLATRAAETMVETAEMTVAKEKTE
jgi:hypothetical protein